MSDLSLIVIGLTEVNVNVIHTARNIDLRVIILDRKFSLAPDSN